MLRFVLHKLISKKWLALCLLIGNILLVAVASSNPLYTDAVLQRALTKHLSASLLEDNLHPAELRFTRNDTYTKGTREDYAAALDAIRSLPEELGLPIVQELEEHTIKFVRVQQLGIRGDGRNSPMTLSGMSDFKEHAKIVSGTFMSGTVENGVIEGVISQVLQREYDYLVGDEYELTNYLQEDGTPYRVKIVGIYAAAQESDIYWNGRTTKLNSYVVIDEDLFHYLFSGWDDSCRRSYFLDYSAITPDNMYTILDSLQTMEDQLEDDYAGYFTQNITEQLNAFLPSATQFKATLLVLYAPIFALLAAFIFMVSRQLMELEENEIAVIVSRGSKRRQIVLIYFLQALLLAALGALGGYPLGFFICQLLGSSNAFLEFVQRQALPLSLSFRSMVFALGAAAVACGFMTLPVIRYAGRSIVQYKVQKQARDVAPFWQKIFLDVLLLGVSLYALYSFNNQKAYLAEQVLLYGSLDPLLYFSSSIFIIGAGLFGIRLVPYVIRLIYSLGRRFWSPAVYTACLRVIRTRNQQSFIMLFMILTISLGIFNAASARTINSNGESRLYYMNGADMVIQEVWQATNDEGTEFQEPGYDKYDLVEGVTGRTKVYVTNYASVSGKKETVDNVTLMGINTKEFGLTANFDTSLMSTHWYHYLNAISQDPYGVLVSSNFRDVKGYKVGDTITLRDAGATTSSGGYNGYGVTTPVKLSDKTITATIYGFVDYWPGFSPTKTEVTASGDIVTTNNYLVVASLAQLQLVYGAKPYEIWFNMEGSTQPLYDFIAQRNVWLKSYRDVSADVIEMKNEPLFQGTNGILTANFIVVLLLCMVGFLIYWVLSIRSRELQFGIFRAMGMSMGEVLRMLVVEQVLISGTAIAIGVGVGLLVTRLYLPLIQIAYSTADQVLPLRLVTETGDYVKLFSVIGIMVVICIGVLAWLISRIRIAQALKLGED